MQDCITKDKHMHAKIGSKTEFRALLAQFLHTQIIDMKYQFTRIITLNKKTEHDLSACTVDNPLAKADYLSIQADEPCSID